MFKKALTLLLLAAGCSDPEPRPELPPGSPCDKELQQNRDTLYGARTVRIRFRGEWPHAVAVMPHDVTGTVLLGEGDRAKITMAIQYAPGKLLKHEAVSDGTTLWRSPSVEAAKFDPGAAGLRRALQRALAWHGVGWSFPQGTHPTTLGEGWVVCDLLPQDPDWSPSHMDSGDAGARTISHLSPGIDYRVRLTYDPATHQIRKRELIGDKGAVWYVETYLEVQLNASIPEEEFKVPAK